MLHYINQRATPIQYTNYIHALLLHKIYNDETMSTDWIDMYFNQHFNQRDPTLKFFNTSTYKIGNNLLANRFTILNGKIELSWLNEPYNSYKIKCKAVLLRWCSVTAVWVLCKYKPKQTKDSSNLRWRYIQSRRGV